MKICPKCGGAVSDDALFCTICGIKLAKADAAGADISKTTATADESDTVKAATDAVDAADPQQNFHQEQQQNQEQNFHQGQPQSRQQDFRQDQQQSRQQDFRQDQQQNWQASYQQSYDPYDHTAEFDPRDISDNKVVAMLPYLMGTVGIIIAALIGASKSPYTMFHVRQALKFTVVNALLVIIAVVLFWTFLIPVAAGILALVLWVIKIICFFQICGGKAKEAAIIRSLQFLR